MAERLVAEHLTKKFGALTALDDVSIDFRSGEIHAVLGENGAGKSTLMNILSGFLKPQSGNLIIDNLRLPLGRPQHARKLGVEMVHQHFTLVPAFSVKENLALARVTTLARIIDIDALARPALDVAKNLNWSIDPDARVGSLPVGVQQRIEILKCLSGRADVLIFDEPTAVLAPDEVLDLFRVLRKLRDEKKIVILIAHKLSEVLAIADRVTVLRQGKFVATAPIQDVDAHKLAEWMVGEMPDLAQKRSATATDEGLQIEDVSVSGDRGETAVQGVSLRISKGEIVGIGGVDGNGQIELAEALALVRKTSSGSLMWRAQDFLHAKPSIAYIPQDRQSDGLALEMSVQDNLLIKGHELQQLRKGPFLVAKNIHDWIARVIKHFDVRTSSPQQPAGSLSGGNQQKIVVGRNLNQLPDLIVAVNPTRGLDVRATRFVHDQLRDARDRGAAIVLFSTDLDELAEVADRTLFISRGVLTEASGAESLLGGAK